jgi:hypothetical protein
MMYLQSGFTNSKPIVKIVKIYICLAVDFGICNLAVVNVV